VNLIILTNFYQVHITFQTCYTSNIKAKMYQTV